MKLWAAYDRVLLGLAVVFALAVVAWWAFDRPVAKKVILPAWPSVVGGESADDFPVEESEAFRWLAPQVTSEGDWGYALFSPPEIFFDQVSGLFTLAPAQAVTVASPVEEPFGVELVGIEEEEFPVQLVGYVGAGSSMRGVFQVVATGETILAGPGDRFAEVGYGVRTVRTRRIEVEGGDGETYPQQLAEAELVGTSALGPVTLNSRERRTTGVVRAMLRIPELDGSQRVCVPGESFLINGTRFSLDRIDAAQGRVEMVRESPLGEVTRAVLSLPTILP